MYQRYTSLKQDENAIPSVSLSLCQYDKTSGVLKVSAQHLTGIFPRTFFVNSHHTGKEVRFISVGPDDVLYDQDGWDGEMAVYRPLGDVPNVSHAIVSHNY